MLFRIKIGGDSDLPRSKAGAIIASAWKIGKWTERNSASMSGSDSQFFQGSRQFLAFLAPYTWGSLDRMGPCSTTVFRVIANRHFWRAAALFELRARIFGGPSGPTDIEA